jgi:hypothetical protein
MGSGARTGCCLELAGPGAFLLGGHAALLRLLDGVLVTRSARLGLLLHRGEHAMVLGATA